jgi:hypothetical protein
MRFVVMKDQRSKLASPQIPGMGRVENTSRGWVPFGGLTPLVRQKTEIGRPIDGEAPVEPPIGYGSTDRSIFPESQFGTVTRRSSRWGRSQEVQTGSMPLLVRVEIAEGVY